MPNTHTTLNSLFIDISSAIRAKTGSNGLIKADDLPTAIDNLPVAEEYDGTVEIPVNYLLLGGED